MEICSVNNVDTSL